MLNQNLSPNFVIKRGEIYWVRLDAKEGSSVQGGGYSRPCAIIQNDLGNKYSPTTIIAPITSKISKRPLPTHVFIGTECGVKTESVILLEQLITVDKSQLGDYIGKVPFEKITEIDMAFAISGGLQINKKEEEYEVFDINKANKILKTLRDTEEMLQLCNNDYFRDIKSLVMTELKTYCKKCRVNYLSLLSKDLKPYLRDLGDVMSV